MLVQTLAHFHMTEASREIQTNDLPAKANLNVVPIQACGGKPQSFISFEASARFARSGRARANRQICKAGVGWRRTPRTLMYFQDLPCAASGLD